MLKGGGLPLATIVHLLCDFFPFGSEANIEEGSFVLVGLTSDGAVLALREPPKHSRGSACLECLSPFQRGMRKAHLAPKQEPVACTPAHEEWILGSVT